MTTSTAMQSEDATQLTTYKKFPLNVVRGEGVWVYTEEGDRYLDLYGGHAVAITGHCHPKVVEALQRQAERLIFYSNLVYNDARAKAAAKLVELAPEPLKRVFFVNSGAEANENAIKLARKLTGRSAFVSFEGGFHGRTMGALSATEPVKYRESFGPRVPDHYFAPFGELGAVEKILQLGAAGVLVEPIQSMAGVRMAPPEFYTGLRQLCDRWGALLIYDEIQTGMGRTGDLFFSAREGATPDMLTLAKGIASGVPMGALLVRRKLAANVGPGDLGTTFGGGPLACAALLATLDVIAADKLLANVRRQSKRLRAQLRAIPEVVEVLGLGFLVGIRFKDEARPVQRALLERRILTGLSDDPTVLRLLPPLTLKRPEIDHFIEVFKQCMQTQA